MEVATKWHRSLRLRSAGWLARNGDSIIYATPDELAELMRRMVALVEPSSERVTRRETRPPGARPISVLHVAVPNDRRHTDA